MKSGPDRGIRRPKLMPGEHGKRETSGVKFIRLWRTGKITFARRDKNNSAGVGREHIQCIMRYIIILKIAYIYIFLKY